MGKCAPNTRRGRTPHSERRVERAVERTLEPTHTHTYLQGMARHTLEHSFEINSSLANYMRTKIKCTAANDDDDDDDVGTSVSGEVCRAFWSMAFDSKTGIAFACGFKHQQPTHAAKTLACLRRYTTNRYIGRLASGFWLWY